MKFSRLRQSGVSLVEVLLTLVISTSMLIGISSYLWDMSRSQQDTVTAQYQNLVSQAAQSYIQDNYATIQSGTFPATITVPQLVSGNYLASGMTATNPLGQTVCVKIIQPTSTTLSALVMATGTTTTVGRAAHIASLVGALGGAVDSTGALLGTGGSWGMSATTLATYGSCSAGAMSAGQYASLLFFSNGSLVSDFLHRSYVGSLTANTMNVPLGLSLQTSGSSCSSSYLGFISRDSSGNVLACVYSGGSYIWTASSGSWKSPVASYSTLPTTGNSDGDSRLELTNYRAYSWNSTTSAWVPLAVDNSGNLSVPGVLSTTTLTASGTITSTGVVKGGGFTPTLSVTAGTSCSAYTSGTIATNADGSGLPVSCQSGYWTGIGYGYGQSWYNLTTTRALGTTYTNSTYRPITVNVYSQWHTLSGLVNGVVVISSMNNAGDTNNTITFTVPSGAKYSVTNDSGLYAWWEFR